MKIVDVILSILGGGAYATYKIEKEDPGCLAFVLTGMFKLMWPLLVVAPFTYEGNHSPNWLRILCLIFVIVCYGVMILKVLAPGIRQRREIDRYEEEKRDYMRRLGSPTPYELEEIKLCEHVTDDQKALAIWKCEKIDEFNKQSGWEEKLKYL